MLSIEQCRSIYEQAVKVRGYLGNIRKAKEYLDAGDTECFERVCRGRFGWLPEHRVTYTCTDGAVETWHDNGQPWKRYTYVNGKPDGLYESWYPNGRISLRCTNMNGDREGLFESWYDSGQPSERYTYVEGKRVGVFETWYPDGRVHSYGDI